MKFINALAFCLLALLILIQTKPEGTALMESYKGLSIAYLIALIFVCLNLLITPRKEI